MNTALVSDPTPDAMLTDLAALGMRAARVVVRMMEIEQAAAEVVAGWLPPVGVEPVSLERATVAGQGLDMAEATMRAAVPRVEGLARALDRVSRSVRRSLALRRRIEAGWPRVARSDDRAAMVRRQVARGVGAAIRSECDGEAAERLFDELSLRLDDLSLEDEGLDLPVEEMVRRVCLDLGLARAALEALSAGDGAGPGSAGEAAGPGDAGPGADGAFGPVPGGGRPSG